MMHAIIQAATEAAKSAIMALKDAENLVNTAKSVN